MRLAGMCAGTFVMVEMLIFQGVVKLIPQAVFSGVLFKVRRTHAARSFHALSACTLNGVPARDVSK
jgi:MFS superfamily sulfate permease-like transporter